MSNTEVGVLIDPSQPRDAIHIAVAPVRATTTLAPGSPIAFVGGSNTEVANVPWAVSVGIVDPFLRTPPKPGDTFWMWLHPNTITSLRHDWTHPAFTTSSPSLDDLTKKAKSEEWLRDFCAEHDCPYEGLISAVTSATGQWVDSDQYHAISISEHSISVQGQDAYGEVPEEFWDHVERVTGIRPYHEPRHFSCSC